MKGMADRLLGKGFRGRLREDEPLDRHSSLKVGGPAAVFAVPVDEKDLEIVTGSLEKERWPWMVVGGGTNILFANGGYAGCVISMGQEFSEVRLEEGGILFAGASLPLSFLVARTGEEGLSGLECLSGIPGTVGGAVRMNAGTRSGDVSETLVEARIFSGQAASSVEKHELGFGYRRSEIREAARRI